MTCQRLSSVSPGECQRNGRSGRAPSLLLWGICCVLGAGAFQGCGSSSDDDSPRGQCSAPTRTKVFGRADLPRGACEEVDDACELSTRDECPGGTSGPLETWRCTCQDESWQCTLTARSLTVCLDEDDAGDGSLASSDD
jgi:hypothetical protein